MSNKFKIELRPVTMEDKEQLAFMANNIKIWNNLRDAMPYPYTLAHAESFIQSTLANNGPFRRAILYNEQFCGMIGIHAQEDIYRQSVELGYWIGEPYWGKGIATAAVGMMTELAFLKGYIRIFAGVFAYNHGSSRVLEKNGYINEGISKNAITKSGQIIDEVRWAKTQKVQQIKR